LAVQVGALAWIWRSQRDPLGSIGPALVALLVLYHAGPTVLGWLSDRPKLAYRGLTEEHLDLAQVGGTLALAAIVAGYMGWRRLRRTNVIEATSPPAVSTSVVSAAAWTLLAGATVAATAAAGSFNIRSAGEPEFRTLRSQVLYYMMYPAIAMAGVHCTVLFFRSRRRWVFRLPLLLAVAVVALSGRRLLVFVVAISMIAALPGYVRAGLGKRFLAAGLLATVLLSIWIVSLRVYTGGRTRVIEAEPYGSSGGLAPVVRTYWEFIQKPGAWFETERIRDDVSYRTDGQVFLAQVMAGQSEGQGALGGECLYGGAMYVVPSLLWPDKTRRGLEYCEDRSVRTYMMPPVDYTPTVIGETAADVTAWGAIPVLLLFGILLRIFDVRLRTMSFENRALAVCTAGQGVLVVEWGWLGLLISLRTLLILWVGIALVRIAWGKLPISGTPLARQRAMPLRPGLGRGRAR